MSFEHIISNIQGKPEIWLSSHPLYKNKVHKIKVWRELAVKLKIEENTLKKKWKHLKDQYRKELKKQPLFRSGVEYEEWATSWQYFSLMSFIKDELMPSATTGTLNSNQDIKIEQWETIDTQTDNVEPETDEYLASPTPSAQSSISELSGTIQKKRRSMKDDILEIERQKLLLMERRLEENQKDEDLLFFKSILPIFKKLTELQRLQLRGKINDWLIEAVKENERAYFQPPPFYGPPGPIRD